MERVLLLKAFVRISDRQFVDAICDIIALFVKLLTTCVL